MLTFVALFSFVSCQKEEGDKVLFTGTIEKTSVDSKTSIQIENNTGKVVWEAGDAIAVYDQGAAYTLDAIPTGDDYTTADFTGDATPLGGPYTAIYPASIATSATGVTLPTEQDCTNGTHFTAPMYAYSTSTHLVFKNLCGVLQLNLPAVEKTITSIELTTPNNVISGDFAVDYNGGNPTLTNTANGGHTLTLNCGEQGMDCSQGLTLYIYLPAGDYTEMTFAFEASDASCCLKHFEDSDEPIIIERNTYYPTTFGSNNFAFLGPAKLVTGTAFNQTLADAAFSSCTQLVFEYKSTRPASTTLLSTADSPAPIYCTIEGTKAIVYTPAARMDANSICENMFKNLFDGNCQQIDFGSGFNTSFVWSMYGMFQDNPSLQSLDLTFFKTGAVEAMQYMFDGDTSLVSLDLSGLTVDINQTNYMFNNCTSLQTLNLNGFSSLSGINQTFNMFNNCKKLSGTLDLSGFDFSSLPNNSCSRMFRNTASETLNANGKLPVLCPQETIDMLTNPRKRWYVQTNLNTNTHIEFVPID